LKRLIVTADDFGRSLAINEAVENAHREGILTTASLMVGELAAEDALRRARSLPGLNVGLHLVVVDGIPVLPATEVPDLVDADGAFSRQLVRSGWRFFASGKVRRQLEAEIRAQFEAFRASGLELDHVNAHHHMQLHPTVADLILRIGRDYTLRAIRVPDEPPLDALCDSRAELRRRKSQRLFLSPWLGRLRRGLKRSGTGHNDHLFGLYDTNALGVEKLVRILAHLPAGTSELMLHPAKDPSTAPRRRERALPGHEEYRALVHPRVARSVDKFGIELTSFGQLAG
jgi:hopanoid biosynthesis associated protein HpnK